MIDIDPAIVLELAIVSFGIALIYLARFSRQQHDKLRANGYTVLRDTLDRQPKDFRERLSILFFGPGPKSFERLGELLVVLVIAFVAIAVLGIVAAIAITQLRVT